MSRSIQTGTSQRPSGSTTTLADSAVSLNDSDFGRHRTTTTVVFSTRTDTHH